MRKKSKKVVKKMKGGVTLISIIGMIKVQTLSYLTFKLPSDEVCKSTDIAALSNFRNPDIHLGFRGLYGNEYCTSIVYYSNYKGLS